MKPTGAPHPLVPIAAWQPKLKTKNTILGRIQAITRELETIQSEIHSQLTEPVDRKKSSLFEDSAAVQVLSRFKAELDQLRRILWFYLEEAAQKPPAGMDQEQAHRLERVTGLLRALSPHPDVTPTGEQSGSFFERLNVVIDNYMQEKKPAVTETEPKLREQTKTSS